MPPDTPIMRQGQDSDAMYLLQEGQAVVSQRRVQVYACPRACTCTYSGYLRTCVQWVCTCVQYTHKHVCARHMHLHGMHMVCIPVRMHMVCIPLAGGSTACMRMHTSTYAYGMHTPRSTEVEPAILRILRPGAHLLTCSLTHLLTYLLRKKSLPSFASYGRARALASEVRVRR